MLECPLKVDLQNETNFERITITQAGGVKISGYVL